MAEFRIGGARQVARAGDTVLIPPNTEFAVTNVGAATLEVLPVLPVGGQVNLPDGTAVTPLWAS